MRRAIRWLMIAGLVLGAGCRPATTEELLGEARAAAAGGDLRTAEIHLKNLLQADPASAEARAMLGQLQLAAGDFIGAEVQLATAIKNGADPAALQLPLLGALFGQGKFAEVVAQAESGPTLAGDDRVRALSLVGAAQRNRGAFAAAADAYRAAVALSPDAPAPRADLAAVLLESGSTAEAHALAAAVWAEHPDSSQAAFVLGTIEFAARRYAAAEDLFQQAASLEARQPGPRYAVALARLIETELALRKIDDAARNAEVLARLAPANPTAMLLQARVELARGDVIDAERRLEKVAADTPRFTAAYRLLGDLNTEQRQFGQAEMYLRAAMGNDPTDVLARLLLAEAYLRQNKVDEARQLLGGAEAPDDESLFLALAARTSVAAGQPELAAEYFEESTLKLSGDPRETANVAGILIEAGELDRAARMLETAEPDGAGDQLTLDYLLALVQIRQGDLANAVATTARLAAANPNSAWPLALRGAVASLAGDIEGARSNFERALAMQADYVPALLGLAQLGIASGDRAQAVDLLRRVLAIEPAQIDAIAALSRLAVEQRDFGEVRTLLSRLPESPARLRLEGELSAAQGNFADAAGFFARAFAAQPDGRTAVRAYDAARRAGLPAADAPLLRWIAEHPNDVEVGYRLGAHALERGDEDEAVMRYEAVLLTAPNHVQTLNDLAWLYSLRADARALSLAERANELLPNNPSVLDTLGWIHVQRDDLARGLPLLQRAAALAPDEPEIRYHHAAALARRGDDTKAREELTAALASGAAFASRDAAERLLADLRAGGNR